MIADDGVLEIIVVLLVCIPSLVIHSSALVLRYGKDKYILFPFIQDIFLLVQVC